MEIMDKMTNTSTKNENLAEKSIPVFDMYSYNKKSQNPNIIITISLYLLTVVYALSVTMLGPLMSTLISEYKIRLSHGGLVVTFQNVGGILSIALGSILADRIKKSKIIIVAYIVYGASLLLISTSPSYGLLLGLFFTLGAGTRMVDSISNAFIADLHPDKRGTYLNMLHGFFAIGALLGPIYSQYLINRGITWNKTFSILAVICAIVLVIFLIMLKQFPPVYINKSEIRNLNFSKVMKSPAIWALCLIMITYSAHQSGINTWWVMYMQDYIKVPELISSISLSVFWIGIILGRFICSYFINYIKPKYILIWGNLSGGIILTLSIIIGKPVLLVTAIGLAGFLTGAVIPMLVTVACGWYPQNSGTASSMIFFSGSLAQIFFPWLIGYIIEGFSFKSGIIITGI
ncbi:MAG: MFS transporter, partial [Clostridiaceae bacterium]|nr:MFS transporter [Clostridiaceae bacterium]